MYIHLFWFGYTQRHISLSTWAISNRSGEILCDIILSTLFPRSDRFYRFVCLFVWRIHDVVVVVSFKFHFSCVRKRKRSHTHTHMHTFSSKFMIVHVRSNRSSMMPLDVECVRISCTSFCPVIVLWRWPIIWNRWDKTKNVHINDELIECFGTLTRTPIRNKEVNFLTK